MIQFSDSCSQISTLTLSFNFLNSASVYCLLLFIPHFLNSQLSSHLQIIKSHCLFSLMGSPPSSFERSQLHLQFSSLRLISNSLNLSTLQLSQISSYLGSPMFPISQVVSASHLSDLPNIGELRGLESLGSRRVENIGELRNWRVERSR